MQSTKTILLLIPFILYGCSKSITTKNDYQKLEHFLEIISQKKRAMGTVLLFRQEKTIFSKNFGFQAAPIEPIYRIGSISKTYTAVIIAKLVEEGLLNFKDKLSLFYPELPNAKDITIENLLQHRSGLTNFTNEKDYFTYHEAKITEKEQLKKFVKYGTQFLPDEKFEYSNTGYVLLSFIAEKVSKRSYSDLLKKFITKPLNLQNTYIFDSSKLRVNEVQSYIKKEKWEVYPTNTHQSVPLGAGAIAATATDLAKFFYALFNNKLVSKETIKKMTNLKDGYGHGLYEIPYNKKKAYAHNGGIDGFVSLVAYFKDNDTVLVRLINASTMELNDISIALIASSYGDNFELPKLKDIIQVKSSILSKYVGKFRADNFPLAITLFLKENKLFAQADGQGAIALESYSKVDFGFPVAKIEIKFKEDGNQFEFTQGETFTFKKIK